MEFLSFLVVGGEKLLILFLQLGVRDVGKTGGLVADWFVVYRATGLLMRVGCFAAFVVTVEVCCYGSCTENGFGWVHLAEI